MEEKEKQEKKTQEKENKTQDKKYFCYFLGQPDNWQGETYNGYTVNLERRLRQHNGEIKGGAFATTKKGKDAWKFISVITSSEWKDVSRAMQCEWQCRYPTRKKPRPRCYAGASGRINSLSEIFKFIQDPVNVYICAEFYEQAKTLELPSHVTLHKELNEII
jgi:predicted GIY-YIG superfamily endonuclease